MSRIKRREGFGILIRLRVKDLNLARAQHKQDLAMGHGEVYIWPALERKYTKALKGRKGWGPKGRNREENKRPCPGIPLRPTCWSPDTISERDQQDLENGADLGYIIEKD